MVERSAVNRKAVGSSPAMPVNSKAFTLSGECFFIHMGGKAIMEKAKILVTVIFTTLVLMTIGNLIPMIKQQNPDDLMIRYELVIHNTGKYSGLYADEVNADRGMQPFGLSVDVKQNNLHVYILAHKSSDDEVNEYVKWLVSYYGAEVVSGG